MGTPHALELLVNPPHESRLTRCPLISSIAQLVHNFPEDHVTSTGERFWTGAKRFPQVATFDMDNEQHMNFVVSVANILAVNRGLVEAPEKKLLAHDHEFRNLDHIKVPVSLRIAQRSPSAGGPALGSVSAGLIC